MQSGDEIGTLAWAGADGSDMESTAARIYAAVDATPGSNDMPGRLMFATTADGADSPTERLRITSAGKVGVGTVTPATTLDVQGDMAVAYNASHALRFYTQPRNNWSSITNTATDGNANLSFKTAQGEAMNITYSKLVGIGTDNPTVKLTVSSDSPAVCDIHHIDGGTNDEARIILGALAGNPPSNRGAGIAAVNNGAGHDLIIKCSASHSAGPTERLRITSAGDVKIIDGDLIMGTSGNGIDFSATSDGPNATTERFSDYESGTFTPTCANSVTLSTAQGFYVKVGEFVHIDMFIGVNSDNSNASFIINNLPFAGGNGYDLSVPSCRIASWDLPTGTLWVSGNTDTNSCAFHCNKDNANYVALPADSGGSLIISLDMEIA